MLHTQHGTLDAVRGPSTHHPGESARADGSGTHGATGIPRTRTARLLAGPSRKRLLPSGYCRRVGISATASATSRARTLSSILPTMSCLVRSEEHTSELPSL